MSELPTNFENKLNFPLKIFIRKSNNIRLIILFFCGLIILFNFHLGALLSLDLLYSAEYSFTRYKKLGKTMDVKAPNHGVMIPKTLSQSVYNHLKEAIISNAIKSGEKLHEKEIAELFQVSSTPVREAIFMLGAEGLVTIKSHKEVVVKEISHEELKEIFQVLSVLESFAVSLAMDNICSEDLKEIDELQNEMTSYCKKTSIEKYCELNRAIHNRLWEFVPNEFLRKTLHSINNQFQRYSYAQYYALEKPGALKKSLREHEEILVALKTKSKRRLKTLLAKHWGSYLRPSSFEKGLEEYLSLDEETGEE